MAKQQRYDSSHIETLVFPDSVRRNASQYIGSVEAQGVFTIIRELLDNAVDEYLAGRNTGVMLFHAKDGSYWVQDRGAGIPQGVKKIEVNVSGKAVVNKMPTMQAVFGELHTSGKYRTDAYKVSIGSHGIGAKGTNATSEYFQVWTAYQGKWYTIEFKQGRLTTPVQECKAPKSPVDNTALKTGTLIHCKPDAEIFGKHLKFPIVMAEEWAHMMAFMNPGFAIVVARADASGKVKAKKYFSKNGAKDYIDQRVAQLKVEAEADVFEYRSDLADVVVAFTNYDGCDLRGFTNGLHNTQGGHHVDAVSKALFTAISKYKGKRQVFTRRDFDEGLLGIVNAKLHKASFSSQDKAKLTDVRMTEEFEAAVAAAAAKFLAKNKAMANRLCERASKLNELKSKFKASKEVNAALSKMKRGGLPPNYAPPHRSVKVADRELFIVEGDSAAGGLRKIRQPQHGLLPLTGKIANCFVAGTELLLADGTTAAIETLLSPWDGVGFSSDRSVDSMSAAFSPRSVSELVELVFDDGYSCKVTPDHLFLTKRGYVPAKDLRDTDEFVTVPCD